MAMKNSYIYMIGEVVPKLLNFMLLPIMTRYLTPEDYGIIGYVDAIILFVFIFSVMALNSYLLREYFELNTERDKKRLIGNFFLFLGIYNFALFFVSFALLYFLFQSIEVQFEIIPILTLALLVNLFEVFNLFPQIIYRVQEKASTYVYFVLSKTVFQFIAVLFFLEYFFHGPISKYYGLLLISVIFSGISFLIVKKNAIFSFNNEQLKDGFKFSFPLVLAALSFTVVDMSDRIILEKYVTMADIGIYTVAYVLGFSINVIIKGSYKAFEPLIFKNSRHDDFLNIFKAIKNEFLTLVLVTCFLVILFSQEIILLMFSEDYYEAYLLMPIIVLAAFAKGIYTIQVLLLMINRDTRLIGKIMFLGAIINISINLIFIETYGAVVASLSTFVAFLVMSILVHLKGFKYYRFSYLTESKDYLFIALLSVLVYAVYYHLELEVTFWGILGKIALLLLSVGLIIRAYGMSILKVDPDRNELIS